MSQADRPVRSPLRSSCVSRREVLRIGSLGGLGLSLPTLLRAMERPASSRPQPRADACILIFLNGGPSHLDMWDMKPSAPTGIRGEFQPISSSLPGVGVCEHMPRLARQMHRATLVRSMHHSVNNAHALAVYTAMTGHDRGDANTLVGAGPDDHPSPGSTLARLRPPERVAVPYVALPYRTREGAGGPPQPGFYGGFLGRAYDPLFIVKDPNAADFAVPELTLREGISTERLRTRRRLFGQLQTSRHAGPVRSIPAVEEMDAFQQRAMDLLLSETTRRAFRIAEEPDNVREAYGRNIYGQSVLLARRLIEAGTRLVTISWAPHANATWDTHGQNFVKLKKQLLPQFDAACATLLEDLSQRGLLSRTLVAVLGDFGRTPRINGNAGRDHWNYCYTVMLAGGGIRAGYVHGASDAIGAFPARDPETPASVLATMYTALGIPADLVLYDRLQRPHHLVPNGRVISQLLD